MHTTRLCRVSRVLDGDHVLALAPGVAERRDGRARVVEQPFAERGIDPGARDDARAVARTDLGLIGVDQDIERSGIDVAFLREHRLQRADAHVHFAELAVIVVLMRRHDAMLARSGPSGERASADRRGA